MSHVAAVGTEQAFGCAVVLGDNMLAKGTLLTAHHSQALHAASAERVGVHGGEMLRQLLELQKGTSYLNLNQTLLLHITNSYVKWHQSCFMPFLQVLNTCSLFKNI